MTDFGAQQIWLRPDWTRSELFGAVKRTQDRVASTKEHVTNLTKALVIAQLYMSLPSAQKSSEEL